MDFINKFGEFIEKSVTPYHAVESIKEILINNGFDELCEKNKYNIKKGGKYFVIRNGSSIIAFTVGADENISFKITASHSDSPCFKIKENAEISVRNKYMQLNTEGYGGMLLAPWFDRPLSVAGRLFIKENGEIKEKLINIDRDLCIIPNVAIHMNRKVNEGYAYNKQVDMLPLFGGSESKEGCFKRLIAKAASVQENEIIGSDLFLYNRACLSVFGENKEFFGSPRIDNLECVFATLMGFINNPISQAINVYACFDNEEVGSRTGQGADSTFLYDTLKRVCLSLGGDEEEFMCAVAKSFMLSCDNAHAVHPNHPEKTDATNCVYLNDGIVIKSNADQKYTSDGYSIAVFKDICEKAGVPYQFFANRSDEPGGSTLGNISMSHVSVHSIDIGLPQLAMHSPYETAGVKDIEYMVKAVSEFYK